MKARLLLWFSLPLFLLSCDGNKQSNDGTKLLDYKYFTIRVPQRWKRVYVKGIDSFVGRIDIDSLTSIGFNMGWYCDSLEEDRERENYMIENGNVYLRDWSKSAKGKDVYYFAYYGKADSTTLAKVRRNNVQLLIVDNYKSKFVYQKKPGTGTTGVFIDSLWKSGDHADGFVLSADNLTLKQQQQLIAAIKTLKFYQHPSK